MGCGFGSAQRSIIRWGAHWRHVMNVIELSMCGGDVALCHLCYFDHLLLFLFFFPIIIVLAVVQYSCPTVGLASRPVSAPVRDARLSTDRRPRDKYADVKSSGYSRQSPPSKLTASKSAYSPAIKQRTGQMRA